METPAPKISMNQGAAYWASITGAPRPHRGTLIRWAIKGCRGKRLRAETLAGRWFTTTEAVEEFRRHVSHRGLWADREPVPPWEWRAGEKGRKGQPAAR